MPHSSSQQLQTPLEVADGTANPRPLKIAFLVHDYHRAGGHSRYVAELATRLAKVHEVHVFANRIEDDGTAPIHFHKVPAWRARAATTVLSFMIPVTLQVGRDFDIIHSQGFCGFCGNVFTAHICNRAWHLGLEKLNGGTTFTQTIFDAVAGALEYLTYHFARRKQVIAISHRVAADLVKHYRCPAPMTVIHHGVDLDVFSPETRARWRQETRAKYGLAENEPVFLFVGDLRKGGGPCIRALAQLESGKLLFVSRSRIDPYQRIVDEAGLKRERVLFVGPTSQVERFYSAADAFLLPTPYDAFGMVVSEAMACGLPVIVSREAGASELIEHGVNGLLLDDYSSATELAACMKSLAHDSAWGAQLGRMARRTVESMSWDSVTRQTMEVYRQLVKT